MTNIQRRSPVSFLAAPVRTEEREYWNIVLEYQNEEDGPWLIDLSHKTRQDIQDSNISDLSVLGNMVPEYPNACAYQNGVLINRMNRTQASTWHLAGLHQGGEIADIPLDKAFTDTTDATVFLALAGENIFAITEKLTDLDFLNPQQELPFLTQGPFSHVPCQIVVLNREELEESPFPDDKSGLILLTCSRGYAHDMVDAILKAGEEYGIRPAGEDKFSDFLKQVFPT